LKKENISRENRISEIPGEERTVIVDGSPVTIEYGTELPYLSSLGIVSAIVYDVSEDPPYAFGVGTITDPSNIVLWLYKDWFHPYWKETKMSIKNVSVEFVDYKDAVCRSMSNCVLANAIHRCTKDLGWLVEGDALRHYEKDIYYMTPDWFDTVANVFDEWINPDPNQDEDDKKYSMEFPTFTFKLNTETGEVSDYQGTGSVPISELWKIREDLLVTAPSDPNDLDEYE
jgi:hypothetical protein